MPAELMRALILEHPGCLSLATVPQPQPQGGELLIRVKAATTCGTDVKAFVRGHPQIPMPGPFGHEYSGIVEMTGPTAPFQPGDAVMGVHSAPCQACTWCLSGQENLCESIMATKVLGAYAEYILIPERIARVNAFPKPPEIPFAKAALLEPFACVAQGVLELRRHGALPARSALVIGPGAIGLMFVAALKKCGIGEIVLAGRNPARLAVGVELGASPVEWTGFDRAGFDIVIECTGQVDVWERSVQYPRRGGIVVLFGGCATGTRVTFDTRRLHYDQISLISPFHFGTEAVRTAREWLLDPALDLSPLLSGSRSLEEGAQVFADLVAGRGIKYVFEP